MSRNSVKVMMYSYFLILKSYINTYISIIYTESTVSNIKLKGNHNYSDIIKNITVTVRNVKPQGNHNSVISKSLILITVSNIKPQGNHNI